MTESFDESLLTALLDGELSDDERREVESRLATDRDLVAKWEELKRVKQLVASSIPKQLPVDLTKRILSEIVPSSPPTSVEPVSRLAERNWDAESHSGNGWKWFSVLAACIMLVFGLAHYVPGFRSIAHQIEMGAERSAPTTESLKESSPSFAGERDMDPMVEGQESFDGVAENSLSIRARINPQQGKEHSIVGKPASEDPGFAREESTLSNAAPGKPSPMEKRESQSQGLAASEDHPVDRQQVNPSGNLEGALSPDSTRSIGGMRAAGGGMGGAGGFGGKSGMGGMGGGGGGRPDSSLAKDTNHPIPENPSPALVEDKRVPLALGVAQDRAQDFSIETNSEIAVVLDRSLKPDEWFAMSVPSIQELSRNIQRNDDVGAETTHPFSLENLRSKGLDSNVYSVDQFLRMQQDEPPSQKVEPASDASIAAPQWDERSKSDSRNEASRSNRGIASDTQDVSILKLSLNQFEFDSMVVGLANRGVNVTQQRSQVRQNAYFGDRFNTESNQNSYRRGTNETLYLRPPPVPNPDSSDDANRQSVLIVMPKEDSNPVAGQR